MQPLSRCTLSARLPACLPLRRQVVDVGCGIGGSSRYLVRKYGCEARGITLSPNQAARANALTQQQGLGDKASFQVAGAPTGGERLGVESWGSSQRASSSPSTAGSAGTLDSPTVHR